MSIRVLIAESNPFIRVGLATILSGSEGIEVCGVYDSGEGVLAACPELQPDVVLIDRPLACEVRLPVVRELCGESGSVLVFLDRLQEEEIFEMLSAGVAGFIAKRDDPELLCQAIRAVADGEEVWISPRVSRMLIPPRRNQVLRARLSEREQAILRAMALGSPNSEIAREYHLSAGTVRNLVSAIYTKIGVEGRSAAVAWAWRNGMVATSGEADEPKGPTSNGELDAHTFTKPLNS
jgi:DNA-binding NarL/FixJ family response regulator